MKKTEIIIRFKNQKIQDDFIGQMMDGFGENFSDFTHWHETGTDKFDKQYCPDGRLICIVNEIFKDNF
jgi:hypothetical protein